MARAQVPQNQKAKNAGISLPPSLIRKASRFAAKRGMSLSALTREIFLKELNEVEPAK